MTKTSTRATTVMAFIMAALMAMAVPALADLDAGVGSVKDSVGYTEDTDTNDGGTPNNQADEGDNAHPSGKDRSVENGGSGTQGKSESNPDDSKGPQRYEGARGDDKANGPGGTDLADQDGNNGCGNDDDFNDDNNGWCGKPKGSTSADNSCSEQGHRGWECTGEDDDDSVEGNSDETCPDQSNMGNGHGNGNDCGSDDNDDSVEGSEDDQAPGSPATKVTICHATGSSTNPFVEITVSANGLNGHGDHAGDIIPMPAGGCSSEASVAGGATEVDNRTDLSCPAGTSAAGSVMADLEDCDKDDSVLGKMVRNSGPVGVAASKVVAAVGAVLPFTGAGDLLMFLVIAIGLIVGGLFLFKRKSA